MVSETTSATDAKKVVWQTSFKYDMITYLVILSGTVVTTLLCTCYFIFLQFNHRPAPAYFHQTADAQLIQNIPLNEKNMGENELLNWVTRNLVSGLTYNFVNIQERTRRFANISTNEAFKNYLDLLTNNGAIREVIQQRLVLSAKATEAPKIRQEGVANNIYTWVIAIPIEVTFRNLTTNSRKEFTLTLKLERALELDQPLGVRISNLTGRVRELGERI